MATVASPLTGMIMNVSKGLDLLHHASYISKGIGVDCGQAKQLTTTKGMGVGHGHTMHLTLTVRHCDQPWPHHMAHMAHQGTLFLRLYIQLPRFDPPDLATTGWIPIPKKPHNGIVVHVGAAPRVGHNPHILHGSSSSRTSRLIFVAFQSARGKSWGCHVSVRAACAQVA
eukprot:scaffold109368_cov17-Tisochrysis_lutea.AAC.1